MKHLLQRSARAMGSHLHFRNRPARCLSRFSHREISYAQQREHHSVVGFESLKELACEIARDGRSFDISRLPGATQLVAHQLGLLYGQLAQRTLSPFRPPQCIVASSNSYSRQPRDERSLLPASISAQREISARSSRGTYRGGQERSF